MSRYIPEILFGFLEVAMLIVQFFTNLPATLFASEMQGFSSFVGLQIGVLFVYVATRAGVERKRLDARLDSLSERTYSLLGNMDAAKTLHDEEFYYTFEKSIDGAKSGVAITHLDTQPPQMVRYTSAERYYSEFKKLVKKKKQVRFRRTERASQEKKEWLQKLIDDFEGCSNFSLGCLLIDGDRQVPHISVQIVDENETFLVAVKEHYKPHGLRDIVLHGRDFKELWEGYYDRVLWRPSVKIIENGKVNETEWTRLKSALSGRSQNDKTSYGLCADSER